MDLDDLHARVPAAQEEDLLEELARELAAVEFEAHDAELARAGNPLTGEPAEPGGPGVRDEPAHAGAPGELAPRTGAADEPAMRTGQVLGLVEHMLGACVIAVHRRSA